MRARREWAGVPELRGSPSRSQPLCIQRSFLAVLGPVSVRVRQALVQLKFLGGPAPSSFWALQGAMTAELSAVAGIVFHLVWGPSDSALGFLLTLCSGTTLW